MGEFVIGFMMTNLWILRLRPRTPGVTDVSFFTDRSCQASAIDATPLLLHTTRPPCRSKAEAEKLAALKAAADNDDRVARDRFGNAKSISSAQFESNNDTFRNQENQVTELAGGVHLWRGTRHGRAECKVGSAAQEACKGGVKISSLMG